MYQEDNEDKGPSYYKASEEKWAISSTGYFLNGEDVTYTVSTKRPVLNTPYPELYRNARLSPLSLKYYGLCLQNGDYTVVLHFAEIIFTDDQTYFSLGKRLFDVSIQVFYFILFYLIGYFSTFSHIHHCSINYFSLSASSSKHESFLKICRARKFCKTSILQKKLMALVGQ